MSTSYFMVTDGNNIEEVNNVSDEKIARLFKKRDISCVDKIQLKALTTFNCHNCIIYCLKNATYLPINEKATKVFQLGIGSVQTKIYGNAVICGINVSPETIDSICDQYIHKIKGL